MAAEELDDKLLRNPDAAELAAILSASEEIERFVRALSSNDPTLSAFSILSPEEKQLAIELVAAADPSLIDDAWGVLYRFRPPTIEEFFDPYYIGGMSDFLYPKWRENLTEAFQPDSIKNEFVYSGAIGLGKTTVAILAQHFNLCWSTALRKPQAYYEKPPMAPIYYVLLSITREKAVQALYRPTLELLRDCEHFVEVSREDQLVPSMTVHPTQVPFYAANGNVQFPNNIWVMSGSNEMHAISLNILSAILDEAEFRAKKAGSVAEEGDLSEVMALYYAVRERIRSRFMGKMGTLLALVSSKRFSGSPVETYIRDIAEKDPYTQVYNYPQWEVLPKTRYPSGKWFKVFVGGKAMEPRIIEPDEEFECPTGYRVIDVPMEHYTDFRNNIYAALRNLAGIATENNNPFFTSDEAIKGMFDKHLWNFQVPIRTDMRNVHSLIELLIESPLVYRKIGGQYAFKRAPNAPRFLRFDMSEVNDHTGVSMMHKEVGPLGEIFDVADFAFDIEPGHEGINLEALWQFARDLRERCGISFRAITADRASGSVLGIQTLKNEGYPAWHLSVDTTKEPYILFRTHAINGLVKMGHRDRIDKEVRGLEDTGKKIDHPAKFPDGSPGAKDISDTLAGNIYEMAKDTELPTHSWDDLNRRLFAPAKPLDQIAPAKPPEVAGEDLFHGLMNRHFGTHQ